MIGILDVFYQDDGTARAACVMIADWGDGVAAEELSAECGQVAAYQPGEFYRRELPCLLAVLAQCRAMPEILVVDGYVWLDEAKKAGLGGHLFEALERKAVVIGVAKTKFATADSVEVLRGGSTRPLYVTVAGMDQAEAVRRVAGMHGKHRVPTMIKRADQLCRGLSNGGRYGAGMNESDGPFFSG